MKLSKKEFKKKLDEKIQDEDLKIELLEDVEDSFEVEDTTEKVEKSAYDEVVAERDEIKRKYKERFFKTEEDDETEEPEGMKEEEVFEKEDIFEEVKEEEE